MNYKKVPLESERDVLRIIRGQATRRVSKVFCEMRAVVFFASSFDTIMGVARL